MTGAGKDADSDAAATPGPTDAEVRQRVDRGEVNRVPTETSKPAWDILWANVCTRFNSLLGPPWPRGRSTRSLRPRSPRRE